MAAKTPKKFRQARKAAKVEAKKTFSGSKKARLKDPFTKYSKDDIEVLKEMKAEAKKGYITDDKGNKIKVKPTETAQERMARDRAAAKAEALRMYPYDKAELEAMSKADRQAAELAQKRLSEPKSQKTGKPAPKVTEAGKVRSAVTAPEPKPQGYKVDKTGKKIKTGAGRSASQNALLKQTASKTAKPEYKSVIGKNGKRTKTFGEVSKAVADKTKAPVVKKGFAAGKELNAEGRAIYDKLIKEGVKPKSALNKALFRQEKGAKVAAKAAAPIAKAAKSAADATKKYGRVTFSKEVIDSIKRNESGMTARQEAALQRRIRKEDQRMAKLRAADPKKFDAREALARNTKITPAEYAKERAKIGDTVRPKPAVAPKPGKFKAMQDSKQKLSTSKELVVRPKAGPVAVKAATASAKKKFTAKAAALGAARLAGKAVTGKVGMAVTAASLLGKPVLKALVQEPAGAKRARIDSGKTPGPEARSNQPRITGQGKFIGKGVGVGAGGSTYRVNAGDTLSGIAKKSGVTLSELMAANKKIKDPRKIYRNTAINIPSKGKVPAGGYAGPVPYRPKKK